MPTEPRLNCKICGGTARYFGVRDANDSCMDRDTRVRPLSGETVVYNCCEQCGFVYTTHFDNLTEQGLGERLYGDGYADVDPEFREIRPRYFANIISRALSGYGADLSLLDYGGGEGAMVRYLLEYGYPDCDFFDPFFPKKNDPRHATISSPR